MGAMMTREEFVRVYAAMVAAKNPSCDTSDCIDLAHITYNDIEDCGMKPVPAHYVAVDPKWALDEDALSKASRELWVAGATFSEAFEYARDTIRAYLRAIAAKDGGR